MPRIYNENQLNQMNEKKQITKTTTKIEKWAKVTNQLFTDMEMQMTQ